MKNLRWISLISLLLFCVTPNALAAKYDIKEMTPAIQQALSSRQNRYNEIQALKAQGALGENKSGYLEVLAAAGNADGLASAENSDRRVIYQAIVEQNQLGGADGLEKVEEVFADVQRDKARSGDSIQLPSGEWTKK